jgi:thiol-disulfide isomerase/thioredoxin
LKIAICFGWLGVVLAVGCGAPEVAVAPEVGASEPREVAPDPTLAVLEAELGPLHLDELAADQVVVVQVGAEWCEPCRRAEQHVRDLQGKDGRVTFVHVVLEEDAQTSDAAWALDSRTYAVSEDGPLAQQFRVLPTTLVYARSGELLVERETGFDDARRISIERAVAASSLLGDE